ncbi:MAG TPA: cysteine desulfurase [Lachnospiraceae bacterium]|nr:cysteine desulfurase [Lachnospiraceae bacterium]
MSGCKACIYMNNAATSWPKPPGVAEAMAEAVRALPGEAGRGGIRDFDVFHEVRKELALLMEVSEPEQIALGCNSTWALNQGIFGYPLRRGDRILYSRAEHNAVLRPLHRMEKQGIRTVEVPVDRAGRLEPGVWERAVREHGPKLCVFTHASNVTGAVNDAETLTAIAKEAGADVFLDISQTLGCVPVRLSRWRVDMAAFTGHKYLLGPQGTGGLYVRPGLSLEPHMVGGTGVKSDLKDMPDEMPLRLEAGTGNEPSFHGLLAALTWRRDHPMDKASLDGVVKQLAKGLMALGCRVIVPGGAVTPVVSFSIPGVSPGDAADILTGSYDIILRSGLHCAPEVMKDIGMPGGTLRLSLSRFTTEEEVEQTLRAVRDIIESGGI